MLEILEKLGRELFVLETDDDELREALVAAESALRRARQRVRLLASRDQE